MHPLRFIPIFKDYLWGGQRLSTVLGKSTGPGVWAESWEIVDHVNGQSVVEYGELAGQTLSQLIASQGPELLGEKVNAWITDCLLYTSPSPRDGLLSRMPSSA